MQVAMTAPDPIVIASAARTPMGGLLGELASLPAPKLGARAIEAALERGRMKPVEVDEVIVGNVLQAGQGQAPARQASLGAGIPDSVGCTTINKMCGSGMKAAMFGHDLIAAGSADVVVAGGMESMTNAPHLMLGVRAGTKMGPARMQDHMFLDGLEDAYEPGRLMGAYAEETARHYQFTREAQDEFAITSLERALAATDAAADEIVPVTVKTRKSEETIETDEQPRNARPDKIPTLRPAFAEDGSVTAANSSSISDGAAALVLMSEREAEKRGLTPLARILGHSTYAGEPAWFTTAPIGAVNRLLEKLGWTREDVDLWEINEAFAVVTMAAMRDLDLDHETVNVRGGACALGHPVGASGARIIVTLLSAMAERDLRTGVASLCIGGGEATAMAFERLT